MQNLIFSCIESRIERNQTLYGRFKLGPFSLKQGLTIANTLRRLILADLEGISIVFIKIEGVKHEYSILKGIRESVLEILTNLKQIQFRTDSILYKPQLAYLNVHGPKIIYAGDIRLPSKIQCVEPNQYIATIASGGELKIKIFLCQGKRYCLQSSLKPIIQNQYQKILNIKTENYLFLDAVFLPIRQVNYTIEEHPELKKEFIIFEIWTKGGVHPKQSLFKAINEIIRVLIPFRRFYSLQKFPAPQHIIGTSIYSKKLKKDNFSHQKIVAKINSAKFQKKLLTLDISNLSLSFSTYFYLKKANIHTISDLVNKSKDELFSLKGFTNELFKDISNNFFLLGLELKK